MNEGGTDVEAGGQEAHPRSAEPLLVDAAGVGTLLGISRNMVWKLHSTGRLGPPPVRLGRCVRWRVGELRAWVEAGCPARDQWQQLRE